MKLSTECIVYSLRKRQQTVAQIHSDRTVCHGSPAIYTGQTLRKHRCYICPYDAAPPTDEVPENCLLVFAACADLPSSFPCDTICLPDAGTTSAALNDVQSVFEYYQDWDDRLNEIFWHDTDEDIQLMLDISAPVLENYLMVLDSSFFIVGQAYDTALNKHDSAAITDLSATELSPKNIQGFYEHFIEIRDNRDILYDYDSKGQLACIFQNLFSGNVYIGCLTLHLYHRELAGFDEVLLKHLAMYLQRKMIYGKSADPFVHLLRVHDVFRRLLQGNEIDRLRVDNMLKNIGFRTENKYICIAVRLPEKTSGEMANYVGRKLLRDKAGAAVQIDPTLLHIIINADVSEQQEKEWEKSLQSMLSDLELPFGISRPFRDFLQCRRHDREACLALNFLETHEGGAFLHFEDCVLRLAVQQCCGQLMPEQMYNDDFLRLLEHDKNSSASYVDTLYTWLELGCNTLKAAKRMYIQRNSLLSRLIRIRSLLKSDLDDPDVRFYLQLCIRLYRESMSNQQ